MSQYHRQARQHGERGRKRVRHQRARRRRSAPAYSRPCRVSAPRQGSKRLRREARRRDGSRDRRDRLGCGWSGKPRLSQKQRRRVADDAAVPDEDVAAPDVARPAQRSGKRRSPWDPASDLRRHRRRRRARYYVKRRHARTGETYLGISGSCPATSSSGDGRSATCRPGPRGGQDAAREREGRHHRSSSPPAHQQHTAPEYHMAETINLEVPATLSALSTVAWFWEGWRATRLLYRRHRGCLPCDGRAASRGARRRRH